MDDYEKKKFVAKAENLTVGQLLDVWAEEELKIPGRASMEPEILQGFLQAHAPGQVAAQHGDVVLCQHGEPLPDTGHIIPPPVPEDLHGLVGAQRQMQVANGIQRHTAPPFLVCS